MNCCTGGRHCRRAFMIMMASAIAVAAIGSVLMMASDSIDATGETSGMCGDDLVWIIDSDGNLIIDGTGPMQNFELGKEKWGGNTVVTVTIGDSVTSVGDYAFYECTSMTSAIIGDSVQSIGNSAFFECKSLKSISMGNSVESIGKYAFWFCDFKSIDLPKTLKSIGDEAFFMCDSLESVFIPDSMTAMGTCPFDRCASLRSITVESGNPAYTSSDGVLFDKTMSSIIHYPSGKEDRSYVIPDSVKSLEEDAFDRNVNLEEVAIPESVTKIGKRAFAYCTCLESVTISGSVTEIGTSAFQGCSSLESAIIPDSVTEISDGLFLACTSLKSVTLPDTVTKIGDDAFSSCTSLGSVAIPDSVTTIGNNAFSKCTGLVKIGFGWGIASMKNAFPDRAFYDSDGTTVLGNDASDYTGLCFIGTSADKMVKSDWPVVTVTFDANGGWCSEGSVETYAGRIAFFPVPVRDGYAFDGWSASASGGTSVTWSTLFVEDATVYAQWKEVYGPDNSLGTATCAGIAVVIALIIAGTVFYKKTRRSP